MLLHPEDRVASPEEPRDVSVQIASRPKELRAAFSLVYQSYLNAGLAEPNPHEMRVTPYHLLPTTEIFIATVADEIVATVSLVVDGELGLPMEDCYPAPVLARRVEGIRMAEVSCLADRRASFERSLPAVIRLMSLMAQCAIRRGVDELMIAVHPRHAAFYRRFAGFEVIGEEKSYRAVRGNPAVALAMNFKRATAEHPAAYRRFLGEPFPEEELEYQPISEAFREELTAIARGIGHVPTVVSMDSGPALISLVG